MALKKIKSQENSEEIIIKNIAFSIEVKESLKSKFPNAVSKLSDVQISELNNQLHILSHKFGIKDTQLDEHLQAVSDLTFDNNGKKVTLKEQDISIAFDQDGQLGIFVGDTHIDDFIQEYKEKVKDTASQTRNPLLNPLYDKVKELEEELLLGEYPDLNEGKKNSIWNEAASLYIDCDYLNSESTSEKIDSVKNLIKYINEGSLAEHLNDNDLKSALQIFESACITENRIEMNEFTDCLVALSKTKPNLTFKLGKSYTQHDDGPKHYHFDIVPYIVLKYITPEHIGICKETYDNDNEKWENNVISILPVKYKEPLEKEFLKPVIIRLFFNEYVPDWVHSGNDHIMYIESKNTFEHETYLSDVGAREFRKYNGDDEELWAKQTDEKNVFRKWLGHPEITAFTCMYPRNEKRALENCLKSIKERLDWQFKELDIDDLQDSLVLLSGKGNLKYDNINSELKFNGNPLYMRLSEGDKIEFIANDSVVLSTDFKQPLFTKKNDTLESNEISLNGVTIDSSKFCKNVFHQSVRYKWDSWKKRKENEHIDIMLGDNLSKKDAIRLALHFMQQYVKPDEVLDLEKEKSSFDYSTDCYDFLKFKDKGTLVELFSRLEENSNLENSDENVGRINVECKGNSLKLWFRNYSEGYNHFKIFEFSSDKTLFPNVNIEVRDKHQCALDKKERMYAEKKKGYRW